MWRTRSETENGGCVVKLAFDGAHGKALRFADVLGLLRDDERFRTHFDGTLAAAPFAAFRWETPGLAASALDRVFECVLVDSPGLDRRPDPAAFAAHFGSEEHAAVFANLGADAIMIAPVPPRRAAPAGHSAYGHLAAFVRGAPEVQRQTLWRRVGETMLNRIGDAPIWLNTAGAGVPWLHIRLDSRPKYYHYAPYANANLAQHE